MRSRVAWLVSVSVIRREVEWDPRIGEDVIVSESAVETRYVPCIAHDAAMRRMNLLAREISTKPLKRFKRNRGKP